MNRAARQGSVFLIVTLALAGAGSGASSTTQSPEGVIVARNGDLYAVPLANGRTVRLTRTRAWEAGPSVSPDGSVIAYERSTARAAVRRDLWIMSFDGKRATALGLSGNNYAPAWTPDGETLYFVRRATNDNGEICGSIWRVRLRDRRVERITALGGLDTNPAISPDGTKLAYGTGDCEPGFPYGLQYMTIANRRLSAFSKLPRSLDGGFAPAWSPDGTKIAFGTGLDDPSRVWVARADGSLARPITKNALFAHDAEWSPDGSLIALIGDRDGGDVYVVKPNGSALRQLTRARDREFSVDWLPRMPPG